jgi:hypothetical protein
VTLAVLAIHVVPALFVFALLYKALGLRGFFGSMVLASVSYGLCVGFGSCVYFGWLVLGRTSLADYKMFEGAAWALFALLSLGWALVARLRREEPLSTAPASSSWTRVHRALAAGLAAATLCQIISFVLFYRIAPHGIEDAISIWNLRARFLFRGGEHWTDGFLPINWHGDYPLLLPCEVARSWTWAGGESTLIPALLALSFPLAILALLAGAIGLLAGLVLLGHGYFFETAASQLADVPLAFFVLVAIVSLALADCERSSVRHRFVALAGLSAGLAAWTKNEGFLFLVFLPACRMISRLGQGSRWERPGEFLVYALGALPVVLLIFHFKLRLAPSNDLVFGQSSAGVLAKVFDLSRSGAIMQWELRASWNIGPGLIPALVVYAWLLGRSTCRPARLSYLPVLGAIIAMCYFAAYLTSPHDLQWHLDSSLERLLCHLWPAVLFTFFLWVASPEETATRASSHPGAAHGGKKDLRDPS